MVAELVLADGSAQRVVVRRPTRASPQEALVAARHEHALLERCSSLDILAPKPCFFDAAAAAVVLEHVAGAPDFAPIDMRHMLEQMATQLARIHRVALGSELAFLGRRSDSAARNVRETPARLDASLDEARIRAALAPLWPWAQHNADALLHGDYWPGNLLFDAGKLVAVLDWEEAAIGDPLADVALSRLDICWAFGDAAMHTFTECYRAQTELDWRNLPRWELCIALRPMSNLPRWASAYAGPPISRPDIDERSMRDGHRQFVAEAIKACERS
jgi:aminoglycoside phosphotransferase (APT) family kinase protein